MALVTDSPPFPDPNGTQQEVCMLTTFVASLCQLGKNKHAVGALALLLGIFAMTTPLSAQATNTFIAKSGDWSPPTAWSLGRDPVQTDNCVIPANSSPIGDLGIECGTFSMGSGATLLRGPAFVGRATDAGHGPI